MSLEALNIGATLFSAFGGRRKAPNLYQAHRTGLSKGLGFLDDFGSAFMDRYRQMSEPFRELESNVLQGLQDVDPGGGFQSAFQKQLLQQQSARGLELSPDSAVSLTFAGMRFRNQLEDRARQAAFSLMSASPALQLFGQIGRMDLGLEQAALNSQVRQANRAQMLSSFNAGINNQMAITGMNNQQNFRNQMMDMYMNQGSPLPAVSNFTPHPVPYGTPSSSGGVPYYLQPPVSPGPWV